MVRIDEIMISLIAREVLGKKVDDVGIKKMLSKNNKALETLYKLSKMHDLSHIVCLALKNIGLWGKDEIFSKFQRQQNLAVLRYEQQKYELSDVENMFSDKAVLFLLLKGMCMKDLYPEPWMRTSSDIDILVQKKDMQKASDLLCKTREYTVRVSTDDMVALVSKTGVCIELHCLDERKPDFEVPLNIWEKAEKSEGTYRCYVSDELFYCHTAHMVKNIRSGSCGVRTFLDMYLLTYRNELDYEKAMELLDKNGYSKAAQAFLKVSRVWFDNEEEDKLSQIISKCVILSGVSGNSYSMTRVRQKIKGGKSKYILSRIFLPYYKMKKRFPVLEKHKWLLPFYHFKRLFIIISNGRIKASVDEIKMNASMTNESIEELEYMFKELNLTPRESIMG